MPLMTRRMARWLDVSTFRSHPSIASVDKSVNEEAGSAPSNQLRVMRAVERGLSRPDDFPRRFSAIHV